LRELTSSERVATPRNAEFTSTLVNVREVSNAVPVPAPSCGGGSSYQS